MVNIDKYDRQLRIWGSNGQRFLSSSGVVLINCTASGTETLKNLVLPGIASFHIIDDQYIEKNYCYSSSNFFTIDRSLSDDKRKRYRAEIATLQLNDLNLDVKGSYTHVKSLESADFVAIFNDVLKQQKENKKLIVIAADIPPPILRNIAKICWGNGNVRPLNFIPLIIVKSYGLIGLVRVQVPHHVIYDSKHNTVKPDLRLNTAKSYFPELYKIVNSITFDKLDFVNHGHVPFVIILLKALDKWCIDNNMPNDSFPETEEDKIKFKRVIENLSRNFNQQLNFQEAYANYYLISNGKEISCDVLSLIDSSEILIRNILKNKQVMEKISPIDIMLVTLKRFLKKNAGQPPINGSIPDMTSDNKSFIQLQNIYRNKSISDMKLMRIFLDDAVKKFTSLKVNIPSVSNEQLSSFCKNIYNLQVFETRSYLDEFTFASNTEKERDQLQADIIDATHELYDIPDHTPLLWYIGLRACDEFYDKNGHYPGFKLVDNDINEIQGYMFEIVKTMNLEHNKLIQSTILCSDIERKHIYAKELVRFNNSELQNIASIVGGIASQEAIKLITKLYVPTNGTFVYNGIAGVAAVYKF